MHVQHHCIDQEAGFGRPQSHRHSVRGRRQWLTFLPTSHHPEVEGMGCCLNHRAGTSNYSAAKGRMQSHNPLLFAGQQPYSASHFLLAPSLPSWCFDIVLSVAHLPTENPAEKAAEASIQGLSPRPLLAELDPRGRGWLSAPASPPPPVNPLL